MTHVLGIDIGGTKIAGAVVDSEGRIVHQRRVPTPAKDGGSAVLHRALELARAIADDTIQAVGIGTGGIVDAGRGVVLSASELLPGWAGTSVKTAFEDALHLPCFVDNDVNALAAGEARWGAARGAQTAVVVALGTGVGGAILIGGRLHHGAHFAAGEVGRMIVGDGTLEDAASGPALHARRSQQDPAWDGTSWDADSPHARRAVAQTGEALGRGLVNVCALLDPDVIVVGGGLSEWGDLLLEPARAVLRERLPFLPCPVVPAALGPDASVAGAAALAFGAMQAPPAPQVWGEETISTGAHSTADRTRSTERFTELPPPRLGGAGGAFPMTTLALLPLDERPVNTRYPQMLAHIAGAAVLLPPAALLPDLRTPAPSRAALGEWLRHAVCDAAVVSLDLLAYGGLIASRTTLDSAADAVTHLSVLAEVNAACPVHAFGTVSRAPAVNHAFEEPAYWAEHGEQLALWGQQFHRTGQANGDVPANLRADWTVRRLRNHAVLLTVMDMAARGHITSLLVLSDDTSEWGLPSREKAWLQAWPALVGETLGSRLLMHPGADEAASALVARLLTGEHAPRVFVHYAADADAELIAPYEDRPVRETVAGQIAACGAVRVERVTDADVILGVATPVPGRRDYRPAFLEEDRPVREPLYRAFLSQLAAWQTETPVALADVAYPNGADPLLMEQLLTDTCPLHLGTLAAFGAWNTAGNTLGTVVAQAVCAHVGARRGGGRFGDAQAVFLAHRFLEDWGYQTVTRREARQWAQDTWGRQEPDADSPAEQRAMCAFLSTRLADCLEQLQARGVGVGLSLAGVRLPWRRLFEVDFTLS